MAHVQASCANDDNSERGNSHELNAKVFGDVWNVSNGFIANGMHPNAFSSCNTASFDSDLDQGPSKTTATCCRHELCASAKQLHEDFSERLNLDETNPVVTERDTSVQTTEWDQVFACARRFTDDVAYFALDSLQQSIAEFEQMDHEVEIVAYESEKQMPAIMKLITKDLSEPYSIYTYRYFIHNWPELCYLAKFNEEYVGAVVCKLDAHKKGTRRGYIAMLAVDQKFRRRKIGSVLVRKAIHRMVLCNCDEVVLETEVTNKSAIRLYENLGFVRDKRLFRYYLNGVDAFRLKLWLKPTTLPPPAYSLM